LVASNRPVVVSMPLGELFSLIIFFKNKQKKDYLSLLSLLFFKNIFYINILKYSLS
jgi:hypothetical protein